MINKKAIRFINNLQLEDVKNKTILITGSNSGIGYMSARYASYLSMKVIIACRNLTNGQETVDKLKEEFPDADIRLMQVDTSEEQSIINFANKIIEEHIDIDVFYHNAGIFRLPYQLKEGKELINSTNYFGPYILMSLLLDYLHSLNHEVKVVFTSSIAAMRATNNIKMLTPSEEESSNTRYCNSKLLDAYLFKYLLDKDKSNIKYYLVHPGVTATPLFSKTYKNKLLVALINTSFKAMGNPLWKSSLSILKALSNDNEVGSFYGPSHMLYWRGYPQKCTFLNHSYLYVDEIINKSEQITGYKLIK